MLVGQWPELLFQKPILFILVTEVATLTTNASCLVTKDIVLAIDAKCSIIKLTILTTCVSGLVVSVTIPIVQSMAPVAELLILLIYLKNFTYHTNP